MNLKTDTKEKFTVITPEAACISAIMADELVAELLTYQEKPIPHVILNMQEVSSVSPEFVEKMSLLQQSFANKNQSFVICCIAKSIIATFENNDLLEFMNITPTESEAWDIVQMEEIERELLGDDEPGQEL